MLNRNDFVRTGMMAVGLIAGLGLFLTAAHADEVNAVKTHKVIVIGHRGNASEAPENTLASFKSAFGTPAKFVELDVWRSLDGELMVIHDDSVDRTTNGKGQVKKLPFSEIRKLDAGSKFNPKFAGEKIPTLEEVLDTVKHHKNVVIEIKDVGAEEKALQLVARKKMVRDVLFASFSSEVGAHLKNLHPRARFMQFIWEPKKIDAAEADRLIKGMESIDCRILGINFDCITPALVDAIHAKKMLLNAWTVDNPEDMKSLAAMGVDMITTNAPGRVPSSIR
jgi:glycerophosphoryl diester phosphodiesterase